MSSASLWVLATVLVLAALYADVAPGLVRQWAAEEDYTHGFLILPLALYFVWERREALKALEPRPAALGAVLLSLGLLMLVVGRVGAELFLQRSSLIVVIAGLTWLILGTSVPARARLPDRVPGVHDPAAGDRDERDRVPAPALRGTDRVVLHGDRGDPGAARRQHDRAREHDARGGRGVQRHPLAAGAARARRGLRLLHAEARPGSAGRSCCCRYPSRSPRTRSAWPAPASSPTTSGPRRRRASTTPSPAGSSSSSLSSCCSRRARCFRGCARASLRSEKPA